MRTPLTALLGWPDENENNSPVSLTDNLPDYNFKTSLSRLMSILIISY